MVVAEKAVRKAIEATYEGLCTLTQQEKFTRENKSTGFREVIVFEHQPCRLSYSRITSTTSSDNATYVNQVIKLFVSPEIKIPHGSKIAITQNGAVNNFIKSGEAALYPTHQEIILELFGGWA